MDNKNRNMEDFFKNRLNKIEESESGWNEPPEFIWDKAQPEFPIRKKKKKFFLMFWGALALMALIGYNLMNNDEKLENKIVNATINIENAIVQKENKITQKEEPSNLEIIKKTALASVSNKNNNNEKLIKKTNGLNDSQNAKKASEPLSNYNNINNSLFKEDNLLKNEKDSNFKKGSSTALGIGNLIDNATGMEVLNKKNEASLNPKFKVEMNAKVIDKKVEIVDLLPVLGLIVKKEFDANIVKESSILIKPQLKKNWKWAVGLSTATFIADELGGGYADNDTGNGTDTDLDTRLKIETSYNNINLDLERRLNKHWSFTSGINFTRHNLDFNLGFGYHYFSVLNGENLRLGMSEFSNSIAVNNEENVNLTVIVDQGVTIPEGAPVDFSIRFGVKSTLVEVPLQLQYRWEGRRFIFATGLGFSLNYLKGKLKTNSFELFYEGQRVNMFEENNNKLFQEFSWGVLSSASVKYKITKKINASIFLSVTPFESDLTRVGVGLNYRF